MLFGYLGGTKQVFWSAIKVLCDLQARIVFYDMEFHKISINWFLFYHCFISSVYGANDQSVCHLFIVLFYGNTMLPWRDIGNVYPKS